MGMTLSSSAFKNGDTMPTKYTCSGADVSPPLSWTTPQGDVKSYVLTIDDPDAPVGDFTHWMIYNIPAGATSLPEAVPAQATLPDGSKQLTNDFKKIGYGGPCPPPGPMHRYFIRVYALSTMIGVASTAHLGDLRQAMHDHLVSSGEIMVRFGR